MRILRVVYDFPPPWEGLAPGPYWLSRAQVNIGNHVDVLCGEWPRQKSYQEGGLRVHRLLRTLPVAGMYATYAPAALLWLLAKRRGFDLLHVHNYHGGFYPIFQGRQKDIPYIQHMHITVAERLHKVGHAQSALTQMEWRLSSWIEKRSCEVAAHIICVSNSVAEEVRKWYGIHSSKISVIPNGVNTQQFSPEGLNLRETLGLANRKVLLYVGVLSERKRIDLLIKAVALLPVSYCLLIIGSGPERGALEKLTESLSVQRRVRFVGSVMNADLPAYYRTADALCLLSAFEGMPKVVVEALSSGVPVITSQSYEMTAEIDKMVLRLGTTDPQEVASKIHQYVDSGNKIDLSVIRQKYDWLGIAERIQKLYKNL